ncbi:MAG: hypothetical protein ICV78_11190, partial [Tolypothrix sp. Co-bin9]|nr:hypothetical protein [Tolypothrix sp. Co-bin9]
MIRETTKKLIDDITKKMNEGKDYLSSSFGELLIVLIEQLQLSKEKKFVFLLAGRTGVGKSST